MKIYKKIDNPNEQYKKIKNLKLFANQSILNEEYSFDIVFVADE